MDPYDQRGRTYGQYDYNSGQRNRNANNIAPGGLPRAGEYSAPRYERSHFPSRQNKNPSAPCRPSRDQTLGERLQTALPVVMQKTQHEQKTKPSTPTVESCVGVTMKLVEGGLDGWRNFGQNDALKFVTGLNHWRDKRELLFRLDPSGDRKGVIEKLIQAVLTPQGDQAASPLDFVMKIAIPFLTWMACAENRKGHVRSVRDKLIAIAAGTPDLIDILAIWWPNISESNSRLSILWFIETLMRLDPRKWRSERKIRYFADQASSVLAYDATFAFIRACGVRIGEMIQSAHSPVSRDSARSLAPGGRHSNDFEDYRDIAIIPSIEEIACKQVSFLPTASASWPMLDRLFRLMREDMLTTVKEKIESLALPANKKGSSRRGPGLIYSPAVLREIDFDEFSTWSVKVEFTLPDKHPLVSIKKPAEREEYWESGRGRKALGRDTMVMISPVSQLDKPLIIAEVSSRNPKVLASAKPSIGIRVSNPRALAAALSLCRSPPDEPLALVPLNVALFMYSPVLSRLQSLPLVPFREELDDQRTQRERVELPFKDEGAPIYRQLLSNNPPKVEGLEGTLDPGQLEGAKMAFSQRVTLIQGPPGTGKTYIGTYIASLLVKSPNIKKKKILCVTYTNHAVDDFCEGLIKCGITNIVRLGSGSSSEVVAEYTMAEKKKNRPKTTGGSGNNFYGRRMKAVMSAINAARRSAEDLSDKVLGLERKSVKTRWADVKYYLATQSNSWAHELTLRDPPKSFENEDGWDLVGKHGRKITEDYLWHLWLEGSPRPVEPKSLRTLENGLSCWDLEKSQRLEVANAWIEAIDSKLISQLTTALLDVDRTIDERQELNKEVEYAIVEDVDVILCTTTAAAKYSDLIRNAQCEVVLVEEAGEILESHVLCSLYEDAKSLIMIGDHLQLRPKAENYFLQVESGNGFNYNISLFERLAKSNFPCATLTTQHRMHPDISRLIRPTYPNLQDSALLSQRAPVRGLPPGLRIAFVKHKRPEGGDEDSEPGETSVSYSNQFEAEMATKIVDYFKQQGYENDQLVVLTPYLGQVKLIVNMMEDAVVSGRDANDLHRMDPDSDQLDSNKVQKSHHHTYTREGESDCKKNKNQSQNQKKKQEHRKKMVRVSSIDNYQGEESDIVIISLVRSNKFGRMGFVGDPNRMNVLFSRSRCGMVILGNYDFLTSVRDENSRSRWLKLGALFEQKHQFFDGFPAYCESHERQMSMEMPSDFQWLSPHGGCDAICPSMLTCGHPCGRKCHPLDREHTNARCSVKLNWFCPGATPPHWVQYACSSEPPKECRKCKQVEKERLEQERQLDEENKKLLQKQTELDGKLAASHAALERFFTIQKANADRLRKEFDQRRLQIEAELQNADPQSVAAKFEDEEGVLFEKLQQQARETRLMEARHNESDVFATIAFSCEMRSIEVFSVSLSNLQPYFRLILTNRIAGIVGPPALSWFDPAALYCAPVDPAPYFLLLSTIAESNYVHAGNVIRAEQAEKKKLPGFSPEFLSIARALCELNSQPLKYPKISEIVNRLRIVAPLMKTGGNPQLNAAAPLYLIVRAVALSKLAYAETQAQSIAERSAEAAALAVMFWRLPEELHQALFPQPYWKELASEIFKQTASALASAIEGGKTTSWVLSSPIISEEMRLLKEWDQKKTAYKIRSDVMENLIRMPALYNAKRHMMAIVDLVMFEKQRGGPFTYAAPNLRFDGTAGSGKTTVAEIYAKLLADLGIIRRGAVKHKNKNNYKKLAPGESAPKSSTSFVEATGAALLEKGIVELKALIKTLVDSGGGVLFIDEPYVLAEAGDDGDKVLSYLLDEMGKKRGSLFVVFSGNEKSRMDRLFEEHPAKVLLLDRFSCGLKLDEYDDDQLFDIFCFMLKKKSKYKGPGQQKQQYKFADDNEHWCRMALRRHCIGSRKAANVKTFCNFIISQHTKRISALGPQQVVDRFTLMREDFL